MDWSKVHTPAVRRDPPAPPRIATLWRVVGASQRPIRCATYKIVTGIELRCEYEDREDVLQSQLFRVNWERTNGSEVHEAIAEKAAQWRAAFDGRGFVDLDVSSW